MSLHNVLDGCKKPPPGRIVVDPFTNDGQLVAWLGTNNIVIPYDRSPKIPTVIQRDTLMTPPNYHGLYVVTKVPYHKKPENEDMIDPIFEKYNSNNYYKCFIKTLIRSPPAGGIIIIPIKFLGGVSSVEIKRRQEFFRLFQLVRTNILENENRAVIEFTKRNETLLPEREEWTCHYYKNESYLGSHTTIICPAKWQNNIEEPFPTSFTKNLFCRVRLLKSGPLKTTEHLTNMYYEATVSVSASCLKILNSDDKSSDQENRIVIRGIISKKLQEKIVIDFSEWLKNWIDRTQCMFFTKMDGINKMPCYNIQEDIACESIKQLICSYSIYGHGLTTFAQAV